MDKSLIKKTVAIILTILVFILIIFILHKILNYITLIILTLIFSYLFSIITTFFHSKKINLLISKFLSIIIILIFLIFILFILIPPIVNEVAKIISNFEVISKNFSNFLKNVIESLKVVFKEFEYIQIDIDKIFTSLNQSLGEISLNIISNIFSFLNLTFRVLIEIVFAIIISIFFIFDREKFLNGIVNEIPEKHKNKVMDFFKELNFNLKKYLLGQIFVSLIIGVSLYVFALIFKIPYAGTLAFIAAVAEVVLYIGPILTFLLGLIISFTVSPFTALWFSIFYIAQQQITSFFVYPIVWSKFVLNVSPVVVFITMIFLTSIFGPVSLFFTVPVIIILKLLIKEFKNSYLYERFKNL